MSKPNQKNIQVQKKEKFGELASGDHLAVRSQEAEQLAARLLSPSAFKIWLYITANINNYTFDLYQVDVQATYGVKARSFTDAMKELEMAGYLVSKKQEQKRFYWFFDMPQKTEDAAIHIEKGNTQVLDIPIGKIC